MKFDHDSQGKPSVVGGEMPRDPERAGTVGRRRASWGAQPVEDGNRAERRAYERMQRREARKRH